MLGRLKLKDAHGRLLPLAPHEILIRDPARRARLRHAGWTTGGFAAQPGAPRNVMVFTLTMLVFALIPMIIITFLEAPLWAQLAMAALPAVIAYAGSVFWSRRLAANHVARTYLRAGYCPSCGYDLEAIVPDANDLRTCPECGGVWKVLTK